MIKSIMVALDGSPASYAALDEALAWAFLLKAELRGMFVEDEQRFVYYPAGLAVEGGTPVAAPLPDDEMKQVEQRVRAEREEIQQAFDRALQEKPFEATLHVERGDVNTILSREARAVDLVVMGKRGRGEPSGSDQAGPTTETLIHDALRPVLVVPEQRNSFGNVLFSYDGSRGVQRVLVPGTELAAAKRASVFALAVGDDAEHGKELEQVLTRYWKPHGLQGEFAYRKRQGRLADMILEEARNRQAGLIVMGAFGHNPIRELLFGSTTLEILEHTPCPVLLMA